MSGNLARAKTERKVTRRINFDILIFFEQEIKKGNQKWQAEDIGQGQEGQKDRKRGTRRENLNPESRKAPRRML